MNTQETTSAPIIGAHNTLTAYAPKNPLMWLAAPVWRCQTKTVPDLIAQGCRFFDVRVCYQGAFLLGAHGAATLDVSPITEIFRIDHAAPGSVVRLILEKGDETDRRRFASLCASLELSCQSTRFIGGNFKPTWERLHRFRLDEIGDDIAQVVGSMADRGRWYGRLFPRLWALLHKRKALGSLAPSVKYCLTDFL